MDKLFKYLIPVFYLVTLMVSDAAALSWPIFPDSSRHKIGNSYGEYQYYGGIPYYHPGLDILAPAGTPVYAVKSGYVKSVLTISADLHWRVAIGDSAGSAPCEGWLYAHLDEVSIVVSEGQYVEAGDYLGSLVYWPIADFHHLHFVKIRNSGVVWDSDWEFIGNPLDELDGIEDPDPPVFEDAFGSQRFGFRENISGTYFPEGEPLAGEVDIISRIYDYINHYDWKLAPYQVEYKIEGDSGIPWTVSVCFTGYLDYANNIPAVYADDQICDSRGDYDYRQFYFVVSNTDGDSIIEPDDYSRSWETTNFHNGDYTVYVKATDRAGNATTESMEVTLANYFSLNGQVTFSDGSPNREGTVVTAVSESLQDITDGNGDYSLVSIGGGSQPVSFGMTGYTTLDTIIMMNQQRQLNVVLSPLAYLSGDANFDGTLNLGDAAYLINFVFNDGAEPAPYWAGDANSDSNVNLGDAAYIINYIFYDGPPPK